MPFPLFFSTYHTAPLPPCQRSVTQQPCRRIAVDAQSVPRVSSSTPLATVVVEDTPPIPHDVPSPPPDSDASASDLLLVPDTPLVLDTQSISVSPPPDSLPPLEQPTLPIDSSQPGAPLPSCERPAPHSSSDARAPLRNIENQPPLQPSPSASPLRKRVRVEPSEVQLLSDNMTAALQRLADVQRTQHMELLSEIRARKCFTISCSFAELTSFLIASLRSAPASLCVCVGVMSTCRCTGMT